MCDLGNRGKEREREEKTSTRPTCELALNRLSQSDTFTILATVELRLTPIYQVVMHWHESLQHHRDIGTSPSRTLVIGEESL